MSTAPSFYKRTAVTQMYSTVTQPYCDTAVHYGRTVQVLYTQLYYYSR